MRFFCPGSGSTEAFEVLMTRAAEHQQDTLCTRYDRMVDRSRCDLVNLEAVRTRVAEAQARVIRLQAAVD